MPTVLHTWWGKTQLKNQACWVAPLLRPRSLVRIEIHTLSAQLWIRDGIGSMLIWNGNQRPGDGWRKTSHSLLTAMVLVMLNSQRMLPPISSRSKCLIILWWLTPNSTWRTTQVSSRWQSKISRILKYSKKRITGRLDITSSSFKTILNHKCLLWVILTWTTRMVPW